MRSRSVVILANGSFPTNKIPLDILKTSEFIVCCDGAINKLEAAGIKAHAIVGDLDSLTDDLKRKYQDIIHYYSNQDTNDLTKAINWCLTKKYNDVSIVGATGERDDHMIGNIFLLSSYTKKMKVKMLTDYGTFSPVIRSRNFDSYIGQQVSIFSPQAETAITTANLRYELTNQKLDMLWQGTLNESMGDSFRIDFEGSSLIVYQEY